MMRWIICSLLVVSAGAICRSPNNQFTVKVNLFAGELGYFGFEECGDEVSPTIGIEVGQTYTFVQGDVSNYYHPMGFAYFPDGAHADKPELEPTVTETAGNDCAETATCPAPMYFSNDVYLGTYSNIAAVKNATVDEEDFGLDHYEPLFFYPLPDWASRGPFSIKLRFDDVNYDKDLFYFCHIHQFMSGRIKLLKNNLPAQTADEPALGYQYDKPSEFDQGCGTFGLANYQLPQPQCPSTFVCGADKQSAEIQAYADCLNAMDCAMFTEMSTGVKAGSNVALFIHQMIPHHQNAVNMAKNLLKTDKVPCDDVTDEDDWDCVMQVILRSIINGQNDEIQKMRGVLAELDLPMTDQCPIAVSSFLPST